MPKIWPRKHSWLPIVNEVQIWMRGENAIFANTQSGKTNKALFSLVIRLNYPFPIRVPSCATFVPSLFQPPFSHQKETSTEMKDNRGGERGKKRKLSRGDLQWAISDILFSPFPGLFPRPTFVPRFVPLPVSPSQAGFHGGSSSV